MTASPFSGVGVALLTIFNSDLSVDVPATASLAARLVDLGIRGVLVAGTTGEAMSLDPDERVAVIRGVRDALAGQPGVPLIVGTGSSSGRQAALLTRQAVDAGADAILTMAPQGQVDLHRYFDTVIAAAGSVPVLAYHFPALSTPGISVAALRELPVAGCKDSSGDPDRLLDAITTWDKPVYTGSSALLVMAGQIGAAGAILALANAHPETCIRAFSGDGAAQRDLAPHHLAAKATFPASIKSQAAARFGTATTARLG
jgi:4-hydroxy-tetrahydrodipicolinate synthase